MFVGLLLTFLGVRMNPLNESDVTLLVVKLLCVASVAAIAFGFACWRLSRRKDGVVPARRRKPWDAAFDKWLTRDGSHDLRHS
jgi:hypothetical protein